MPPAVVFVVVGVPSVTAAVLAETGDLAVVGIFTAVDSLY